MKILSRLLITLTMVLSLFSAPATAADDEVMKVVFQVSDNDEGTFKKVMNNVSNYSAAMLEAGKEYQIEIVAYNAGLHLFRSDTSTEAERVVSFQTSIPNLTLTACGNTIKGMTKQAGGTPPPIIEGVRVVPGGVVRLVEAAHEGFVIIRP